jgi:adenylate kinase
MFTCLNWRPSLEGNSNSNFARLIIVGVPGVGKTTVISRASEILNQRGLTTKVVVFGSLMFENAKKLGVTDRDSMRRLSVSTQRRLQEMAAHDIKAIQDTNVLIDTHLFITTDEGRYPGIPGHLLDILAPTHLVLIIADPEDIFKRRRQDDTRNRDLISVQSIRSDLEVATMMIASTSVLCGAPFKFIYNRDGMSDEAVNGIVEIISKGSGRK